MSATDHRRICTAITTDMVAPNPKFRVRFKDLDERKFREALSEKIGGMSPDWLQGKSADECVEILTQILQDICKGNVRQKKKRRKAVPWWSQSLLVERKMVQAARRRFQQCKDLDQRKEYEILYRF